MFVGVRPGGVAVLQTSGGQFVYYLVSLCVYYNKDEDRYKMTSILPL